MRELNQPDYCMYIFWFTLIAYRFPCVTSRNYCEETGSFPLQHNSEVLYPPLVQITPIITDLRILVSD